MTRNEYEMLARILAELISEGILKKSRTFYFARKLDHYNMNFKHDVFISRVEGITAKLEGK